MPRTAGRGLENQGCSQRHGEDEAITPNITVSYMAEQINRGRLDDVAARGSLIDEAYAAGSHPLGPVPVPVILGAALIRLGEWIQGTVRPSPTLAEPAALSAR